ncbi:hypothetical protein [Clostridium vincentii]|uniref:DUF11 domain-containing protein n=1 Tax=Clostridium vincentii TaxID=52704 RepID=A0A2T0B866_9CLOT|nr:hypothetical protein [Clostridium vincentii]PRR80007.1 hypothetical protein CLVI_31460 [Clostridium vincentii]
MANAAQPCNCISYKNICCCEPQNGISVVQPACQTLPDGSVVNNPAFVADLNKSYWSYKFITDCGKDTRGISNFVIPICELIVEDNLIVSEKIDGCGNFQPVPFTLSKEDPNFGTAPLGYQFLKIETNSRYEKGVSVEYRIEIVGDYPIGIEDIFVKAANEIYDFSCDECFLVPKCNPQGKLTVTKNCSHVIENNQATLIYNVHIDNISNGILDNVAFQDLIFLSPNLIIGTIQVIPQTLSVDITNPGEIKISGNLGTINPGQTVTVQYSIPIANVTEPGSYLISNTATASDTGTKDTDTCNTRVNFVKLAANKCCSTEGDMGIFTLTISSVGNSPDILVDIHDHMEVPSGVTVKFLELSGCEEYFSGTSDPIPTNTDISGPIALDFICKNALVPAGSKYVKLGKYQLVSSSVVGTTTIRNSINGVNPVNPADQVFLGVSNIPATANINVQLTQTCASPCKE